MIQKVDPFKEIYIQCNTGDNVFKFNHPIDFPRYLDIELSNHCNLNCLMCPTGNGMAKRTRGFMSEAVFDKILNEIKANKTPVRFIRWGEPLLHPKFIDFVKKLKAEGILVHINTNGKMLDEAMCHKILEAGLDSIKFSFQGVDRKSYREMRNTDFYDDLIQNIERLYTLRGDGEKPFIHISTTTTYETKEQINAFISRVANICDKVSVGQTQLEHIRVEDIQLSPDETKTLIQLKEKENVQKVHPDCMEVFDKLSIDWDGDVTACCGDFDKLMVLGNINNASLKDIWHSDILNQYRKLLVNRQHEKIKLCRTCYVHMDLTKE